MHKKDIHMKEIYIWKRNIYEEEIQIERTYT